MNNFDSTCLFVRETASPTKVQMPALLLGTIISLESFGEHLQRAIELEPSTVLPYLCALYSSNDTEAYYEAVVSQEEIYLEETEKKLRMILASDDPLLSE